MKLTSNVFQVSASVLLLSASALTIYVQYHRCKSLGIQKAGQIISYIRNRYKISNDIDMKIVDDHLLQDSCTREVILNSSAWSEPRVFYLSADQNYLLMAAADLRGDLHSISERQDDVALPFASLAEMPAPTRGSKTAPVVVVDFSDFECSFCSSLADVMSRELSQSDREKIEIKFHNFPLPIHPWAERAAEQAFCVSEQSESSFWELHDYLFSHQGDITEETLDRHINTFLSKEKGIDRKSFNLCSHSDSARHAVAADIALGTKYGVGSTPTMFLNGRRVVGTRSAKDLAAEISKAISHPAKKVETL